MRSPEPDGNHKSNYTAVQRTLPLVLLFGSLAGLAASLTLTYDKLQLLRDPSYHTNCNLSPVLSCESVMKTPQASILGVPNSVYGIVLFSMLFAFSLVLLSGAPLKRWLWLLMQAAATGGLGFVAYLVFESAFRLHTICPWCLCVWCVTIPIFWSVTIRNIREGVVSVPQA